MPGQSVTINGTHIKFNDDFYRDYVISFGHYAKQELTKIIQSDYYKSLKTDDAKARYLDRKLSSIREKKLKEAKKRYKSPSGTTTSYSAVRANLQQSLGGLQ